MNMKNAPHPLPLRDTRHLIQTAISTGAAEAAIIPSSLIVVDDALAKLCSGGPVCPNFGLSASCPPHVPGSAAFRIWRDESPWVLVVRIDFPRMSYLSQDYRDISRLLHDIVSAVEHAAKKLGYIKSRAFAGGSCKRLFCEKFDTCSVISKNGLCRNPETARPSMSGFGVHVARLMESAQWTSGFDSSSLSWMAGLVLLCR